MGVFYDGESLLRLVDVETRFGLFATKEGDKLRAGVAFRPPTGPAGAADGQAREPRGSVRVLAIRGPNLTGRVKEGTPMA